MKKEFLPQKICAVCKKPFTWRKKWEKVWDEVKYCSERCRSRRNNIINFLHPFKIDKASQILNEK
jgi:hypothetical protein